MIIVIVRQRFHWRHCFWHHRCLCRHRHGVCCITHRRHHRGGFIKWVCGEWCFAHARTSFINSKCWFTVNESAQVVTQLFCTCITHRCIFRHALCNNCFQRHGNGRNMFFQTNRVFVHLFVRSSKCGVTSEWRNTSNKFVENNAE